MAPPRSPAQSLRVAANQEKFVMRILVTGGTGLVGTRLIPRLRERGDEVVLLTRRPVEQVRMEGVLILHGDPCSPGLWLEEVSSCDAVVHLAGENVFARRWSRSFKQALVDSRLKSSRLLAETIAASPRRADGSPKIFVSASGIGYYGMEPPEECGEDSPPGSDFLAQLCVDWEAAGLPAASAGVRVVHIRIGVVLDPDGGALPKLVLPFRLYCGGPIGSGRQWVSWIHRDDLIGLFLLALDRPELHGPLNGTAPEPQTNWGVAQTLARVLRRAAWLRAPAFMLRLILGERAELVLTCPRVIPRKVIEHGYVYLFPDLEPALRDLLRPSG